MLFSLLKVNWRLRGPCCLHHQGWSISQAKKPASSRQFAACFMHVSSGGEVVGAWSWPLMSIECWGYEYMVLYCQSCLLLHGMVLNYAQGQVYPLYLWRIVCYKSPTVGVTSSVAAFVHKGKNVRELFPTFALSSRVSLSKHMEPACTVSVLSLEKTHCYVQ